MSTEISDKKTDISYETSDILQFRMKPESLSDYINKVKADKNLTFRRIEENSGGKITAGYVNDLVRGKTKNPSSEKITALARGLKVPEDEVFAIVRGKGARQENGIDRRLEIINLRLSELPPEKKAKADVAIDALDAYLDKLEQEKSTSTNSLGAEIDSRLNSLRRLLLTLPPKDREDAIKALKATEETLGHNEKMESPQRTKSKSK